VALSARAGSDSNRHKPRKQRQSRNEAVEKGERPPRAQWVAPSRPTITRANIEPFGAPPAARVRREGAPNNSRGGCAPEISTESFRPRAGFILWGRELMIQLNQNSKSLSDFIMKFWLIA